MKRGALALLAAAALAGCNSHTVIDTHQALPTAAVDAGETVVLLGRANRLANRADADFVECVGATLESPPESLDVLDADEFTDALYPWFEASTAPTDVSMLRQLFENDAVVERIGDLSLRYLIWIDGQTERISSAGSVSCTVSPAGGGCFGFKTWEDEAAYTATIWDLDGGHDAGKIGTRTHGTSYVPALILPVPLLARVKSTACDAMADQISSQFRS